MSANYEDHEIGKFWQARFKAVRLLDEESLLACAAYVDLNPIRAAMAETLETSGFTSIQRRIHPYIRPLPPFWQDRQIAASQIVFNMAAWSPRLLPFAILQKWRQRSMVPRAAPMRT